MADKPAYIAADSYSVSKQFNGGVTVGQPPLVFKDDNGNIVLTAKTGGWTGGKAALADQNGNEVGYIQKKGIQLGNSATYQFFDGSGKQIGQAKVGTGLTGMSAKVDLQDASGSTVAVATGNFMGFNYEITDATGQKSLAKIYLNTQKPQQKAEAGLGGMLAGLASQAIQTGMASITGSYKVDILQKGINDDSRLFILELVVVLDEMYHTNTRMGGSFGGFHVK